MGVKPRFKCSVCKEETCADLVLSTRSKNPQGEWIPQSRKIVNHMYLCEKHYREMLEFMLLYEEGRISV